MNDFQDIYRSKAFALFLFLLLIPVAASAQQIVTTAQDQSDLQVTIFNNNLALVKDQRNVRIPSGDVTLEVQGVSPFIKPQTSIFSAIGNKQEIRVKELNFDYDLLTPASLLEKHVGKTIDVEVAISSTGEKIIESATVLSVNNGVILKFADRIVAGKDDFNYIFRQLPPSLRTQPTLSLVLNNQGATIDKIELAYLTTGLTWRADYVARLNENENLLSMNGWVTLTNDSGVDFNDAKLQFVSGDVNVIEERLTEPVLKRFNTANFAEASPNELQQEQLADYHIYAMDYTTTVQEKQKKQVALLPPNEIPVTKQYIVESRGFWNYAKDPSPKRKQPVYVWLEFSNNASNKLGKPLPKGIIRVYKNDSKGRAQFIGEDNIDHTALGEKVRLNLGEAYDIKAQRFQSHFNLIPSNTYNSVSEVENTLILTNAQDEDVEVLIRETMFGEWEILQETQSHSSVEGNLVQWKVLVPAEGAVELRYSVRVRY